MTNLSKREVVLLGVLFIAVCGALYFNFIFRPYLDKSDALGVEIEDCRTQINDSKLKKASIAMIDQKMDVIETEMKDKLKNVLDSIDNPAIIVMLNKNVAPLATNVTYSFSSTYKELGSNYITSVEVSFDSTEAKLLTILTNLRKATPVTRVETSAINVTDPATGVCKVTITVEYITASVTPTKTDFNDYK